MISGGTWGKGKNTEEGPGMGKGKTTRTQQVWWKKYKIKKNYRNNPGHFKRKEKRDGALGGKERGKQIVGAARTSEKRSLPTRGG